MKRRIACFFAALLALCGISAGCGAPELTAGSEAVSARTGLHLYYIDDAENQLKAFAYEPENTNAAALIDEFLDVCAQPAADDGSLLPLLSGGAEVQDAYMEGDALVLDMRDTYRGLSTVRELLVRAGLVRTFTQAEQVNYVEIRVDGEPLQDKTGTAIGKQSQDSFVEDASRSINSYQTAALKLYFTDESGSKLLPEERNVYYSTSEPLERAVVEELIRGTTAEGHYPTISPETKVLSVAIQEGVCYVNLDESFSSSLLTVREDVQIYSIVNSLTETCHVAGVQFSINGVNSMTFRETMELDELYVRNEELIEED